MPRVVIPNQTTTVTAEKSAQEIEDILARYGAGGIGKTYAGGRVTGLVFYMDTADYGRLQFRVPVNVDRMKQWLAYQHRQGNVPPAVMRDDQPERIAWRNAKDWVRAQVAMLELHMVDLAEVFLPYALMGEKTLYQHMLEGGFKTLILPEGNREQD